MVAVPLAMVAALLALVAGPSSASAAAGGSSFVAVSPCRVVDTRVGGGAIAANGSRSFQVAGSGSGFAVQGGASGGCGVPADASAVEVTVTAVSPSGSGYLRVWPAGSSMPNATFLNFGGSSITNTGTVAIATSAATPDVSVRAAGSSTQVVIDVQGYFRLGSTPPGAPTSVTATGGNGQATVSWTAPASDGGSPITGYRITPYRGATAQTPIASSGVGTSTTVTGLTNGLTYTFRVSAVNATGTGSPSSATLAVAPAGPPTLTATAVAVGSGFSCGLVTGGGVRCWGQDTYGTLGDGPGNGGSLVPVAVSGISTAVDVDAGDTHACAVIASGGVRCWGQGSHGELGDGNTNDYQLTPVVVAGISTAVSVDVGVYRSCAVVASGGVRCWGEDYLGNGQAGGGGPVVVSGVTNATSVSTGYHQSCAVLATGTVKCWGTGPTGDGTTNLAHSPVTVSGITNAVTVATGYRLSCAVLATGSVKCWGEGSNGQLGDGSVTDKALVPVTAAGITNAVGVSVASDHACAVLADGTVRCWGDGGDGATGTGSTDDTLVPTPVVGITNAVEVNVHFTHSCARLSTGALRCWGSNYSGQLGNGVTEKSSVPVPVLL